MFHKTMHAILATFLWFQISVAETNFYKNDNPFFSGVSGSDAGTVSPKASQDFSPFLPMNEEMMHQASVFSKQFLQQPIQPFQAISTASSTSKNSPSAVEIFVSELNSAVYTSKILPDIFDLRELSPDAFSKSLQDYVYAKGVEFAHSNPSDVAILAAGPIKDLPDVLTSPIMLDIYGNAIAKYLFSKGTLNSSNASSLAKRYARTIEDNAKRTWVKETPESKLLVLEDGYVDYMKSVQHFSLNTIEDLSTHFANEVKRVAAKS